MLEVSNITKIYRKGTEFFTALRGVTLKVNKGDFVAVLGPSGSGKSTFLNVIGGLIRPDSGIVLFKGADIYNQSGHRIAEYRKKHIGFVFQQFHLMPYLTLLQNIRLACLNPEQISSIGPLLEKCSLTGLKNKYPSQLSVGEKQRGAFIRAIIREPDLLLADEPTGNLDPDNSDILMSLVDDYNRGGGTVIIVSHDHTATRMAGRTVRLISGSLEA